MDPLSIIFGAFVLGAAKGAAAVGERVVADGYAALRQLVFSTYSQATALLEAVVALEQHPDSIEHRAVLEEELRAVGASEDHRLLAAAESLLAAAGSVPAPRSIGVDWREVKAMNVKLDTVHAQSGAIGLRAVRSEISDLTIHQITAGDSGK